MKYIAVPIWHKNAAIIEAALRKHVTELEKGYHDLPREEKNRIGHEIHTINGHISGFMQKQYVVEWEQLEKVFYPNKK